MRFWPDELRDNTQSWLHIIDGTLTTEHNAWLRLRRLLCNAFLAQLADPDVNIPRPRMEAMFESLAVAIAAILTDNFHYENVELTKIVQSVKEFMNNKRSHYRKKQKTSSSSSSAGSSSSKAVAATMPTSTQKKKGDNDDDSKEENEEDDNKQQ